MTHPLIDLRSDTVTQPTEAMRRAMMKAQVGDDVFGEDPTVNALQQRMAALFGKEAALFVSSGTMGNQLAIKCHTLPGQEVICEADSHPFNYEAGGPAFLSGVQMRPLPGRRGVLNIEDLQASLRAQDHHFPPTSLVLIENTHNRAGGAIVPLENMQQIHRFTRKHRLALHLDGARLWNAHVATGIPLAEYGRWCDSLTVCLSKGLGAPAGSVLMGSREFIDQAHRYRKMWGGGMRQIGILAAAGLYALDHHIERLAKDHKNAKKLAHKLAKLPGLRVDIKAVQTNMVMVDLEPSGLKSADLVVTLKENGLAVIAVNAGRIRMVTHLGVSSQDIDRATAIVEKSINQLINKK
ncbi:MAG TPA: low-specificity L-threonine aldolase [bacterium]|nr:low-specificity L-threonine aldolase [bacterium]HPN35214.1 low-specificity L-threonine aldolase [bacterium]